MAFVVHWSEPAREHLKELRKRDQQIIVDAVDDNLIHQADQPTRHRKKLEGSKIAAWELRIGDFRVFYDIDDDESTVVVVAIGKKNHNVLRVGDEEITP